LLALRQTTLDATSFQHTIGYQRDLDFAASRSLGDGQDLIEGGRNRDLIFGDDVDAALPLSTAPGGAADQLYGGPDDDGIFGQLGNDVIRGNGGADQLHGGLGGDRIVGGADDDLIEGDAGNDRLRGSAGDDVLIGAEGDDDLNGNAGRDLLRGGDGADTLNGGGNDILLGEGGADDLVGGGGRDLMIGGRNDDGLRGRGADDILIGGTTRHDFNDAALRAVLAEWTSTRTYAQRVNNLMNVLNPTFASRLNGDVLLIPAGVDATVQNDAAPDDLAGENGRYWFFADAVDSVLDDASNELVSVVV
jgi:Ca2+-binding RTX toxin-like protein